MEIATLAGGCFWCTEAIFKRLKGVIEVVPGYSGGNPKNPTYEQVSSDQTGHAESIQIRFDPEIISYEKLLEVFFKLHDPTTLNKQGEDYGTQYRSVIFYHSEKQKQIAEKMIRKIEQMELYHNPVITQIVPFVNFYNAESYHQNYYENNPTASYCQIVIDPKIQKLVRDFKEYVQQ